MTFLFRLDIAALAFSGIAAGALFLIAIGTSLRRNADRWFLVFAVFEILFAVSTLLVSSSLLTETGPIRTYAELSSFSYGCVAPALFLFAAHYTGRYRKLHGIVGVAGLIAMAVIAVPLFAHRLLIGVRLGENGSVAWESAPGIKALGAMPLAFLISSAFLFWKTPRNRTGGPSIALSLVLLAVGVVVDGLVGLTFPGLSVTNALAMGVLGYAVARHQLFNPLRELTREQQSAMVELRDSEAKFRVLSDQSPNMIFINRGGRVVYANLACEETMGYTREELRAADFDFKRLIAPDSLELIGRNFSRHLQGEEVEPYEYGLMTRDGVRLDAIISTRLINFDGVPAILGLVTDISARKRHENLLLALNRAAVALEKARDPTAVFRIACGEVSSAGYNCMVLIPAGIRSNASGPHAPAASGGPEEAVEDSRSGREVLLITVPTMERLANFLSGKRPQVIEEADLAALMEPNDGEAAGRLLSESRTSPTQFAVVSLARKEDLVGVLVVQGKSFASDDLSVVQVFANQLEAAYERAALMEELEQSLDRLKKTQDQLTQSQRLEAVGLLAGGVAHDFNNILTAVGGYAELLATDPDLSPSAKEDAEHIKAASGHAADLTRQLLAFSRRQVLSPEVFDLNLVVDHLGSMLLRLIGEDVQLETRLSEIPLVVHADKRQLEQVVMNLAVNARDAMPRGGMIRIETDEVILGSEQAGQLDLAPGSYVELIFSDNGEGMMPETQNRVFEPFFTTKDHGAGTGLGLSMAYGIIKQSSGAITVDSDRESGTIFRIYLPSYQAGAPEPRRSVETARQSDRSEISGTETILLVEDDHHVRNLTTRLLGSFGYQVLSAENADDAMRLWSAHPEPVDLMLTDVVMPGTMNGVQLAGWARKNKPETAVVLMSGHATEAMRNAGVDELSLPFIAKPFTAEVLGLFLREVLTGFAR